MTDPTDLQTKIYFWEQRELNHPQVIAADTPLSLNGAVYRPTYINGEHGPVLMPDNQWRSRLDAARAERAKMDFVLPIGTAGAILRRGRTSYIVSFDERTAEASISPIYGNGYDNK